MYWPQHHPQPLAPSRLIKRSAMSVAKVDAQVENNEATTYFRTYDCDDIEH